MEKKNKIKPELIAIIGKSASGKNTILEEVLLQSEEPLNRVIQFTTRPKRPHEREGKDYFFITLEDLQEKFNNDEIVELCSFNNWHYGTLSNSFSLDKPNIGVFNPDAIATILESKEFDVKTYYIDASDKVRLLRSLTREENPNIDEVVRRYLAEKKEHSDLEALNIKKTLTNEEDEDCQNCVEYILQAECLKSN